jgi:hypothetical protein
MRRVLRYDGLLPSAFGEDGKARQATPDELRAMAVYVSEGRATEAPFEIIVEGETPGDDRAAAAAQLLPWAEAGATWWIETQWGASRGGDGMAAVRRRIAQGPPR